MLREIKADDPAFTAALTEASLPTDDLTSEPFRYFEWEGVAFGGVGGGADALIRSVVVLPQARGRGYGVAIAESLAGAAPSGRALRP
jgi:GNAT superfamily N-acetyltransferase